MGECVGPTRLPVSRVDVAHVQPCETVVEFLFCSVERVREGPMWGPRVRTRVGCMDFMLGPMNQHRERAVSAEELCRSTVWIGWSR